MAVVAGRRALLGWAAIVIGVTNTPAALIGLAFVACARAVQTRRLRPLLAIAAAAALVMAEAWIRRGGPLITGYAGDHGIPTLLPYSGRPGFSYPFVLGLVSILFSFGRGLLFFAPGLVLWLSVRTRRLLPGRRAVDLQLLYLAGLVVVYSKWWAWYGGLSWGPRFFVFAAVPASLFLATRLHTVEGGPLDHLLTLGVLTLSAWVGLSGMLAGTSWTAVCGQDNFQFESLCWYAPDFSSLWWLVLHPPNLTASTVLLIVFCAVVFFHLAAPLLRALAGATVVAVPALTRGWRF
jgi:hypothetical protein